MRDGAGKSEHASLCRRWQAGLCGVVAGGGATEFVSSALVLDTESKHMRKNNCSMSEIEIEITPDMMNAGISCLDTYLGPSEEILCSSDYVVRKVYQAMELAKVSSSAESS